MSVAEKVSDLVFPLCSSANVELVDIELNGGVLKIVIDQSEGLNTEVLADMTREISRQLDHEEPIPGSYTLEVTSPGLERPLKKPQHFEKAVGSLITLKKTPGSPGERRIEGILMSVSSTGISVEMEDGSFQDVDFELIQKARTVFVWQTESKSTENSTRKEKILDGRIEQ
ncbi:MAG: ribosome maturation factor RimP [Actinomycetota bacterium]|nr:ribosome maturation factor RimP [Actinomycetota bacterium]